MFIRGICFVKKKKSRIIIFDSKYGLRSLSEEEFCSLFQNKVLICKNVGTDNLNVSNKKKSLSYYLFFFVINLFDFFLLTMSTYYINSSSSLILIFLIGAPAFTLVNFLTAILDVILPDGWDNDE